MLPRFVWAPDTVFTPQGPMCSHHLPHPWWHPPTLPTLAAATEGKGLAENLRLTCPKAFPTRPPPCPGFSGRLNPSTPPPARGSHLDSRCLWRSSIPLSEDQPFR